MNRELDQTRRRFLRTVAATAGASAAPFALNLAAMGSAAAASANGGYRALVCVFLQGGNDAFNTVLATDPGSWSAYERVRTTVDQYSIALPRHSVLPVSPASGHAGRSFGLHPNLNELKPLFDAGRVAVVANVGTLIEPATLAQYRARSVRLPPKLFSHNDQQAVWQSLAPEGARVGWGGRMGDLLMGMNGNATFTTVSAGGTALLLAGRSVRQYQVAPDGAVPIRRLDTALWGAVASANPLAQVITGQRGGAMERDHAAIVQRAIAAEATLSGAMAPAGGGGVPDPARLRNPVTGGAEVNPLAVQLQTVARVIAGRGALGARRQVFFVALNGFDTHDMQLAAHAGLMARLGHGLAYFDSVLGRMGLRESVTTFTASDFGRTFVSNGDGSDHGWGAHHFVMGGAVKGREIVGPFPVTGLNHGQDVGSGALLPALSVDQYGATLGGWMGLSAGELLDVFPNLRNFSQRNLGFMA